MLEPGTRSRTHRVWFPHSKRMQVSTLQAHQMNDISAAWSRTQHKLHTTQIEKPLLKHELGGCPGVQSPTPNALFQHQKSTPGREITCIWRFRAAVICASVSLVCLL